MVVFYFFDKEGIITKKQYIVFHWISRKKNNNKNLPVDDDKCLYFKHELKYLRRSGHVIDDVMFLFWSSKYYQVKHYFPVNVRCCVAKRQLSTVLGLVFRLFRSYLFPTLSLVNFKCPKSLVISVLCPTQQNLKYAIVFNSITKSCHSKKG